MDLHKENKIALLIDGDNAHSKFIESMLTEAGKNGKVTIRRIYGDWTGFDTRTYDYATLTELFKSMPDFFELIYKDNDSTLFIRLKK